MPAVRPPAVAGSFYPAEAGALQAAVDRNLARARAHFQEFLTRIEAFLRRDPLLWFNFTPLNPPAP